MIENMETYKTNTTPKESPRDEFTGDLEAQYERVARYQEYTALQDAEQRADAAEKHYQ